MKRRTRKQWYQYHLSKSEADAIAPVDAKLSSPISNTENRIREAQENLRAARKDQPFLSKLADFFGIKTVFQTEIIKPLVAALFEDQQHLAQLRSLRDESRLIAKYNGAEAYKVANAQRKEDAILQTERALARKHEQRIRYLQRSPAIRSASRPIKQHLIQRQADSRGFVSCFYCGTSIHATTTHLEHKRPVSRGGDNRLSNLALACPLRIPAQAGQRFQPKLDSNSKASWTLIPAQPGQPIVIT